MIEKHFYLKRQEIVDQVQGWITEMEGYASDRRSSKTLHVSLQALKVSHGRQFGDWDGRCRERGAPVCVDTECFDSGLMLGVMITETRSVCLYYLVGVGCLLLK